MPTTELTVGQLMDLNPVSVLPTTRVQDVVQLMNQRRIGSILIVNEEQSLLGIFTERDLLRRVVSAVPGWRDYAVSLWMTKNPHTITPDVGWEETVTRMHKLRVRHLPVVSEGKVVGIISTRILMSRREVYLQQRIDESTEELREVNQALLARDAEVAHSLSTAGRLQTKVMLPTTPPEQDGIRWGVYYAPLDHLGGDYYDFAEEPTGQGFLIADASGHSIAAAMVAMMTRFAFLMATPKTSPSSVMSALNDRLQELTEERFVTGFYGFLERQTLRFRFCAAGHPYPLHYCHAKRTIEPLSAQGFLLGVMPGEVYTEKAVTLAPGDRLCFTTDGVLEARNEIGEMYGVERLREAFEQSLAHPTAEVCQSIVADLHQFRGAAPFTDDVTLAVMEIRP
ncbi:MAG: PP2C family protein-serine/threonine phosphatase [Fimbriiglobus sp.]